MKKLILMVIFVGIAKLVLGQTTWPEIGTKWYYDNNKSQRILPQGNFDSRIGYVEYECTKDTIVNTETVRLIKIRDYIYDGKIVYLPSILMKQTNQNIEYKYLDDSQWCFFNTLNPLNNHTFTGYFKNTNPILVNFSISGVGIFTVDGLAVTHYNLHFNDGSWNQNVLMYANIGSPVNFTIYNINPTADDFLSEVPFITNLRCFQNDGILHKFQLSRTTYITPTLASKSSFKCDSLNYKLVSNVTENEKINKFKIYPNPVQNELFIENLNINEKNINIEVFNSQGVLIHSNQIVGNSINVSNLKKGFYYILITKENKKITFKFNKL